MSGNGNRCVTLTLKPSADRFVAGCPDSELDGSGLAISRLEHKTDLEICRLALHENTSHCIGDLFNVAVGTCADRSLLLRGDLSRFHHLAAGHARGTIEIDGDAGDDLGGAMDGYRVGMSGGLVVVRGRVGNRAGYRMRRGEIFVDGNAGDFLAAHAVAGTICVAGQVGNHAGYAMRRGSLLLASKPSLPPNRFSQPQPAVVSWIHLLSRGRSNQLGDQKLAKMLRKMASGTCQSCRGDAAVAGVGEVIWPV